MEEAKGSIPFSSTPNPRSGGGSFAGRPVSVAVQGKRVVSGCSIAMSDSTVANTADGGPLARGNRSGKMCPAPVVLWVGM